MRDTAHNSWAASAICLSCWEMLVFRLLLINYACCVAVNKRWDRRSWGIVGLPFITHKWSWMLDLNDFRLVAICPDETSLITWNSTRTKLWIHILHPSAVRRKQQKLSRSMAARSLGREKILSLISLLFSSSPFQTHTHTKLTHQHRLSFVCPSTWWFSWFSLLLWLLLLVAIVISVLLYFFLLFLRSLHWIYLLLFFAAVADSTSHYRGGLGERQQRTKENSW